MKAIWAEAIDAQKKCKEVETTATEAKSMVEAKIKRLKEALSKVKSDLALEQKKRKVA